jgi:hypothetical protein
VLGIPMAWADHRSLVLMSAEDSYRIASTFLLADFIARNDDTARRLGILNP